MWTVSLSGFPGLITYDPENSILRSILETELGPTLFHNTDDRAWRKIYTDEDAVSSCLTIKPS